jgi:hypothetical protein
VIRATDSDEVAQSRFERLSAAVRQREDEHRSEKEERRRRSER